MSIGSPHTYTNSRAARNLEYFPYSRSLYLLFARTGGGSSNPPNQIESETSEALHTCVNRYGQTPGAAQHQYSRSTRASWTLRGLYRSVGGITAMMPAGVLSG